MSDTANAIEDAPNFNGVPFNDYLMDDGGIDWLGTKKKHVCIALDDDEQSPSRKQLWVLSNPTSALHNFHIHQMKFRLARKSELRSDFFIEPPPPSSPTCAVAACPEYKSYEDDEPAHDTSKSYRWHDTIPVPASGGMVFIIMSFTAKEQIGRYVYHCHILKHEDTGLMAPMRCGPCILRS